MTNDDFERGGQAAEINYLKQEVEYLRSDVRELLAFVAKVRGAWAMILGGVSLAGAVVGAVAATVTRKLLGG
jgi:hypothetical protein